MPLITCIGQPARELLTLSGLLSTAELQSLGQVPGCEKGSIGFKGKAQGSRPRSAYQEFTSACLKGKKIKGFGEAPKAMRECAKEWKTVKRS